MSCNFYTYFYLLLFNAVFLRPSAMILVSILPLTLVPSPALLSRFSNIPYYCYISAPDDLMVAVLEVRAGSRTDNFKTTNFKISQFQYCNSELQKRIRQVSHPCHPFHSLTVKQTAGVLLHTHPTPATPSPHSNIGGVTHNITSHLLQKKRRSHHLSPKGLTRVSPSAILSLYLFPQ